MNHKIIITPIIAALLITTSIDCLGKKKQILQQNTQLTQAVESTTESYFPQSVKDFYKYFVPAKPEKEVIQKKYTIAKGGTFSLHNKKGKIDIEPVWNTNSISITAIKQCSNKDNLKKIKLNEKINKDRILLTVNDETIGDRKSRIDFKIIVPGNTVLDIINETGNITAHQVDKHFSACTARGNIDILGATGPVVANTSKRGNIHISNVRGPVNANTRVGTITIDESFNSVLAATHKGKIEVYSVNVPNSSKIHLASNNGDITLYLPEAVNADVQARTDRGEFTCVHPVTLQPRTTQLDKYAWKKFKQEATGRIGSGESQILLTSNRSNISIKKTEQS